MTLPEFMVKLEKSLNYLLDHRITKAEFFELVADDATQLEQEAKLSVLERNG